MLTGLNCGRHRVYYEGDRLDPGIPTLAETLRERGYATGAVTGAGFVSALFGFSKGFDEYAMNQIQLKSANLAGSGGKEAVEWLGKNSDKPFFLFLHTYQVHSYRSPDSYAARFLGHTLRLKSFDVPAEVGVQSRVFNPYSPAEREDIISLYDAAIRYTDDALIKPVVDALRRRGLYDRTLIVVTSDHGEEFFDHRGWNHTHGVYDELLRIPLIVKMPGSKFKASRIDPIVRITDLMPTILEIAGAPFGEESINGRSLMPMLTGREKTDRVFLAEFAENAASVQIPQRLATNDGRRKLILNQPFSKEQIAFFQTRPPQPPPVELYDLRADPGERTNIADRPENTP
ncbi:MAG: sulfatase, partial [Candidatus Aminicenantales bacterium]